MSNNFIKISQLFLKRISQLRDGINNKMNDWRNRNMDGIAKTPQPPYYAVIFASQRTEGDNGYGLMADKMVELASQQEGFLGVESARDEGLGITVSYWGSLAAIKKWKEHSAHKVAQNRGKNEWYKNFALRVCKVERDSFFEM
jgi:heme-degrading monooxygenase HmoA